jgi:hypothetical protein
MAARSVLSPDFTPLQPASRGCFIRSPRLHRYRPWPPENLQRWLFRWVGQPRLALL